MKLYKETKRLVVLTLICSLLLAACSSGTEGQTQVQTTESEAQTEAAKTETAAQPDQTEGATKDGADSAVGWEEQYNALPDWLQQALLPSSVRSDDKFLTLKGTTLDGEEWDGSSLAAYDMTVIDCWMTWCGPCREEMPTLQLLSQELPENIHLMSICFDGQAEESTCRTIVSKSGVTYPVLLGDDVDGQPISLGTYTQGVPTLLFVDSEGNCFAKFVGRPLTEEIPEKDALNIIINLALENRKGD